MSGLRNHNENVVTFAMHHTVLSTTHATSELTPNSGTHQPTDSRSSLKKKAPHNRGVRHTQPTKYPSLQTTALLRDHTNYFSF